MVGLDNQEAFTHSYLIPKSQLEYELKIGKHPSASAILEEAGVQRSQRDDYSAERLTASSLRAGCPPFRDNSISPSDCGLSTSRKLSQPMCRMHELYVYDTALHDYRRVHGRSAWRDYHDRPIKSLYLENEIPLIQVCPFPIHDYFYGISAVERLMVLQLMRNRRWDQIQHMMELQASPPSYASGFEGDADEIRTRWTRRTDSCSLTIQVGKAEKLQTQIPDDLFAEITYIDSLFDDQMGTTKILSGQGEVRRPLRKPRAQLAAGRRVAGEKARDDCRGLPRRAGDAVPEAPAEIQRRALFGMNSRTLNSLASQFTDEFVVRVRCSQQLPVFMADARKTAIFAVQGEGD